MTVFGQCVVVFNLNCKVTNSVWFWNLRKFISNVRTWRPVGGAVLTAAQLHSVRTINLQKKSLHSPFLIDHQSPRSSFLDIKCLLIALDRQFISLISFPLFSRSSTVAALAAALKTSLKVQSSGSKVTQEILKGVWWGFLLKIVHKDAMPRLIRLHLDAFDIFQSSSPPGGVSDQ